MPLNDNQQKALDLVLDGHNLVLLGAAGTGKTWTVQKIVDTLISRKKKVQITCSTGIACSAYPSRYNAKTIHKFLGIGDGRYGAKEIVKVLKSSPRYDYVFENLKDVDCLFIDECSMISEKVFESIEAVCRSKNGGYLFGGLQVVLCGDFMQLPPVCNIGDPGLYCFESRLFSSAFPHTVTLKEITRTSDPYLIKATWEIFAGQVSEETENYIDSLHRPLDAICYQDSCKLFSKNNLVDDYNRYSLLNFPGELYQFRATDTGSQSLLNSVTAPKILWLKVQCPVVLLQNISDTLVNGMRGEVQSLDNEPVVEFHSGEVMTVPKVKFSVFDPSLNQDIASRYQYPLKPAFGLTIHKAQGMTLNSVEIDCRDIFQFGQLGVALSRVTHSNGLRVINYHPRYVIKPPKIVTEFIGTTELGLMNMSCCPKSCDQHMPTDTGEQQSSESSPADTEETGDQHMPTDTGEQQSSESSPADTEETRDHADLAEPEEPVEEDIDSIMDAILMQEEEAVAFNLPDGFDIDSLINSLKVTNEVTETHKIMNDVLSRINGSSVELFVKLIFLKLTELITILNVDDINKGIPERLLQQFQKMVHKFSTGFEYKMHCFQLFDSEESFTGGHIVICYNILEAVKVFLIQKKVALLKDCKGQTFQRQVTDSSRARIRYVAGYCVAKLRRKHIKAQNAHMFDTSLKAQEQYSEAKGKVDMYDLLKEEELYLKENSAEPESLVDINRRQNVTHGLTNVSDDFYSFFVSLTESCLKVLTTQNFNKLENQMYSNCYKQITENKNLFEQFSLLLVRRSQVENRYSFADGGSQIVDTEVVATLNSLVSRATHICSIFLEIVDKYIHVLFGQFCKDLKSARKVQKKMAHRKQVKVSKPQQNVHLIHKGATIQKTIQEDSQAEPSEPQSGPSEPQPGPSHLPTTTEESDICQKCQTDAPDQWIQCDTCNAWLHRKCAGLKDAKKWRQMSKKSAKWHCEKCCQKT